MKLVEEQVESSKPKRSVHNSFSFLLVQQGFKPTVFKPAKRLSNILNVSAVHSICHLFVVWQGVNGTSCSPFYTTSLSKPTETENLWSPNVFKGFVLTFSCINR